MIKLRDLVYVKARKEEFMISKEFKAWGFVVGLPHNEAGESGILLKNGKIRPVYYQTKGMKCHDVITVQFLDIHTGSGDFYKHEIALCNILKCLRINYKELTKIAEKNDFHSFDLRIDRVLDTEKLMSKLPKRELRKHNNN